MTTPVELPCMGKLYKGKFHKQHPTSTVAEKFQNPSKVAPVDLPLTKNVWV